MCSFEANIYQTFYSFLKWAIRGIDVHTLLNTNPRLSLKRAFTDKSGELSNLFERRLE